jgi:hypothetical protein
MYPSLLLTVLYALLALPSVAQAPAKVQAEPTYTFSLGGGNELDLRIENTGKVLHLRASQKPGSTGKVGVDIRVTLNEARHAIAAQSIGANFSGATVNLNVAVTEGDSGSLIVTSPAQSGTSPVGAPVVTFVDFLATLGRRYNWKKGGPQTFVYLDPAIRRKFATLTVQSEGVPETIQLGADKDSKEKKTVLARLLKITADVPELSEARRVTSLYVGPNGEALKGEMPVTRYRIAAEAAGVEEGDGFITRYPAGIEPLGNARFTRLLKTASGFTITYEGPAGLIRGTVKTDSTFQPISMDHEETWRRLTATFFTNRVSWAIPEQRITTAMKGEVWFITHYVMTGAWENRAPFAELTVGQSVSVTYPTIEWGDRNGAMYTVLRLPNADLTDPAGKTVSLKHWQVSSAPYFSADLWTDGERLVKLASTAGPMIVRNGWEAATKALLAHKAPSALP